MIKKILWLLIIISGILLLSSWRMTDPTAHLYFLDVGQGDSTLISIPEPICLPENSSGNKIFCKLLSKLPWQFYQPKLVLIDGGPSRSVLYQLGEVLPWWQKKIDLVVLTHPHADHVVGLLEVLDKYFVANVLIYPVAADIDSYQLFLDKLTLKQNQAIITPLIWLDWQQQNSWAERLELLWPATDLIQPDLAAGEIVPGVLPLLSFDDNLNNDSIVLAFELSANKEAWLLGDAEVEVEQLLVEKKRIGDYGNAQIVGLKAGHHCSKTASSVQFLRALTPAWAVCSVGTGNKYHHPAAETIQHFEELGIRYYRTDILGRIVK